MAGFATWIAGWFIIILALYILAKTQWGKPIVYYSLWLMVVFLLITHYSSISGILQAANITQGQY